MGVKLTEQTFEKEVLEYKGTAVVTFYAVWCGTCADMEPVMKEAEEKYAGEIKFAAVNMEESVLLAANYEIEEVPTYLLFKNGEMICKAAGGLTSEEIDELVRMAG